jgi:hypothetical protein
MDRQKCLMKAIVDQADPQQVLAHVRKLATAAKRTIATNIPAKLLPALVDLSGTVKGGAQIRSLSFDPNKLAGFRVYQPDVALMRTVTARAIAGSGKARSATPTPSSGAAGHATSRKTAGSKPGTGIGSARGGNDVVSLDSACG